MRPDISDSLISGQPLYLLYSYSKHRCAGGRGLVAHGPGLARDRQRQVAGDRQAAHLQCLVFPSIRPSRTIRRAATRRQANRAGTAGASARGWGWIRRTGSRCLAIGTAAHRSRKRKRNPESPIARFCSAREDGPSKPGASSGCAQRRPNARPLPRRSANVAPRRPAQPQHRARRRSRSARSRRH